MRLGFTAHPRMLRLAIMMEVGNVVLPASTKCLCLIWYEFWCWNFDIMGLKSHLHCVQTVASLLPRTFSVTLSSFTGLNCFSLNRNQAECKVEDTSMRMWSVLVTGGRKCSANAAQSCVSTTGEINSDWNIHLSAEIERLQIHPRQNSGKGQFHPSLFIFITE